MKHNLSIKSDQNNKHADWCNYNLKDIFEDVKCDCLNIRSGNILVKKKRVIIYDENGAWEINNLELPMVNKYKNPHISFVREGKTTTINPKLTKSPFLMDSKKSIKSDQEKWEDRLRDIFNYFEVTFGVMGDKDLKPEQVKEACIKELTNLLQEERGRYISELKDLVSESTDEDFGIEFGSDGEEDYNIYLDSCTFYKELKAKFLDLFHQQYISDLEGLVKPHNGCESECGLVDDLKDYIKKMEN